MRTNSHDALKIRHMRAHDADVIAHVHARSWRSVYRGILRDDYLDEEIFAERTEVWRARLNSAEQDFVGLVADSGHEVVGFVFALPMHHKEFGTYIDSLHVLPGVRGGGIGSRLVGALAQDLLIAHRQDGVYLWATEANRRACRYYERLGAVALRRACNEVPGGSKIPECLYHWRSPSALTVALAKRATTRVPPSVS